MSTRARTRTLLAGLFALVLASCGKVEPPRTKAGKAVTIHAAKPISTEDRVVLFAFDDYSVPSTRGLKVQMLQPEKYSGNPIISRGLAGEPDEDRAQGVTVVREADRRLWYQAQAGKETHAAYAESEDGISWRKPQLGLTEFNGSRNNNLLRTEAGVEVRSVLLNPGGPSEHRYVMAAADRTWWQDWKMDVPSMTRIEVSSDGLDWQSLRDQAGIVAQQNKIMTIYRFNEYFHLGGYQIYPMVSHPMQPPDLGKDFWAPRTLSVWRSPDLERWPLENTKAFYKPLRSSSPYRPGWDREEVHVGAMVTTYPNVCLGVYGQWHHPINEGAPQYRGEDVSVDLGLIISNDGLHFRDPAPGFTFLGRDQELTWDRDFKDNKDQANLLMWQGSMINTLEKTHIYYCATTPGGNVAGVGMNIGLATLPRDRFGYLSLINPSGPGQFLTCPLEAGDETRLYLNAHVPSGASLRIALTDEDGLTELPGYGREDGLQSLPSGLDTPVEWPTGRFLPRGEKFRIRGELEGDGTQVFALYLDTER